MEDSGHHQGVRLHQNGRKINVTEITKRKQVNLPCKTLGRFKRGEPAASIVEGCDEAGTETGGLLENLFKE